MTAKTIGETVIAPVTVESATKRRRATGDGVTEWGIRAFIPSLGIKDYSTPFIIPGDAAAEIMAGDVVMCKLRRGKLKAEKDGRYDTHFFWDCVEWNTQESPPSPGPAGGAGPSTSSQDEYRRSKEEMRWTEALGLAIQISQVLLRGTTSDGRDSPHLEALVLDRANWFYKAIVAGPPQELPQDAPTEAAEPPEAPEMSQGPPWTTVIPAKVISETKGKGLPTSPPVVPLRPGTRCPISGHGGLPLNLVPGDPLPKHPVYIYVQGIRSLDHWCYGEEV